MATLNERQKEIFEKFKNGESKLHGMKKLQVFTAGFKLAVQLLIEVVQNTDNK